MTFSHRSSALVAAIIVAVALLATSCASTKSQAFKLSFLPSTPVVVEPSFEEPPHIASGFFSGESPELTHLALAATPRAPEADGAIVKAEEHFEAGKRFYQQGDAEAARREFDAAMDVLLSAPENLPDRQGLERKLDQMADAIYHYDLEGLGAGVAEQKEVIYDKSPLETILDMTFPTDPNLRPKVKEELEATVSQLPLEENDAVLGYIHYFSTTRGHKTLIGALRRSGRYRAMIQRILDDEGVPQELIYLAQVESGFLPRARSNKQAVGMWQFVQFRGREYGLYQTPVSDDRMDPEKATRAAARHLHDLYALFGDWYLAMAAYNCGPGCVERAVERTGFADYWELRRLSVLPRDTANYVPAILALTIMAKNPKDYDLEKLDYDQPLEYDRVDLDTPTSLALVADAADRPVSEIQDLNPALMKAVAPSGCQLRVPLGTAATVLAALDLVPASHRANWRIHRLATGETLAEIAHRFATPLASVAVANQSLTHGPEAGDLVVVPVSAPASRTSSRRAVLAPQRKASHRAVAASNRPAGPSAARRTRTGAYRTASLTSKRRPVSN
jgi:membrane-bound lytic murein transglycosylase D